LGSDNLVRTRMTRTTFFFRRAGVPTRQAVNTQPKRFHSIFSDAHGKDIHAKHHAKSASSVAQQQFVESWEANLTGDDDSKLRGARGDWWWTGKHPKELISPDSGSLHSLPQPVTETVTEGQVKAYFDNTWTLSEVLFSGLQGEEAFFRPPYHHLRHPQIFYYGHTATFYTNKLNVAGLLQGGINRYFEDIFEVGVDEMRWDDMSKNAMDWPSVSEVHEYRQEVYRTVTKAIDMHIGDSGARQVGPDHPLWALFMAFEHDRIHLETSSVLFRELPLNLVRAPEYWPKPHESAYKSEVRPGNPRVGQDYAQNALVPINGGTVRIGKDREQMSYGWDNEYGVRTLQVPDFEASQMMVSNGEFYEFVRDGGYRERDYWTEDGWGWRTFRNAKWPAFWEQAGPAGKHEYRLRTVFEEVDMPWSWPVNVNKHEASAFCKWKATREGLGEGGLRLVTEAEHMLLREEHQRHPVVDPTNDPALTHGGATMSSEGGRNLNLAYGSETPVDFHAPNANNVYDVSGNAWEWTEDEFNPLDGFEVHPYYDDFSTPCFDGEHNMIMGGSFISSGDAGANLHSRYHFRPHFLQHSGFRYIKPSAPEQFPGQGIAAKLVQPNVATMGTDAPGPGHEGYETPELINQYLALHFGQQPQAVDQTIRPHAERPDALLNFPLRCARLVRESAEKYGAHVGPEARALDLGCAVGGSSFELARDYDHVTGIDFSHGFIAKAKELRDAAGNSIEFSVPVEGDLTRDGIVASLDPNVDYSGVQFMQGDACNLPADASKVGGPFDAVLLANLLCRLPSPEACLSSLSGIVNQGGIVVTVSPFSWLEDFTHRTRWLQQGDGNSADALDALMASNGFEKKHAVDMPLLIREHERKYQYIISAAAVYQKK